MTMTIDEANIASDTGRVWAAMSNGKLWQCRRNGATQTWKTRPGEFRIPVKAGFRGYAALTHENFVIRDDKIII